MTINLDKSKWQTFNFGDLVKNVNESVKEPALTGIENYIGLEHIVPGELQISSSGSTSDGTTFTKRVRPGDTLFGKRRAYQRKVAFADFDAVCSGDILVFQAIPEVLDADLLPFIVMSEGFIARALETSAGSLSPRTRWTDLKKYELSLPEIPEQQEIAALLWACENHLQSVRELQNRLQAMFAALRNDLTSTESGSIPLVNVVDILDNLRKPVSKVLREKVGGQVPYYGAGGRAGWINESLFDEDLVLVGEDATLAVYRISGPSWVNNHAHVLRATGVSQDWLYYCLSGMDLNSLAANGTRLKLTKASLESIHICFPPDIEARTNSLRGIESAQEEADTELQSLSLLKTSLLSKIMGD
jgi:restriction endonuclease S subunit